MQQPVHIVGGGLAGSEAAWQCARAGVPVILHEMRGVEGTEAHHTDSLAELVCSNSFRSDDADHNAVGLLHAEMRGLGSLILRCADAARVPAGSALAVDRDVTLADLRGTMRAFAEAIFGGTREIRMRTSFFPFTEPSVEFDMTCFLCDGAGCAVCKHSGWIEMGGAGEVDPNVLAGVGYDPDEWQGFAWGLGIDRIAFARHGLPDLRLFWENDIRFLSQF